MAKRSPGFYWVRLRGTRGPEVAQWHAEFGWIVCGSGASPARGELRVLSKRLTPPRPRPVAAKPLFGSTPTKPRPARLR